MRIRIYNARILTMEPGRKIFSGEIGIEDGRIIYVNEEKEKDRAVQTAEVVKDRDSKGWDKEIDACGNLIMPGFKNAHTHSPMTFLRSYAALPLHFLYTPGHQKLKFSRTPVCDCLYVKMAQLFVRQPACHI